MKSLMFFICMVMASVGYAGPIMLSSITGNVLHTETDTGDERFRLTDTDGGLDDATAFLLYEYAGYSSVNAFGLYSGATTLEIFGGSNSPVTSSTLSWNTGSDLVTNLTTGSSATINDQDFGFYLDSGDGNTYYSESALNGGVDMMLSFDVGASGYADLFGANLVLGFEDVAMGDFDYNDFVVGVSDISPVANVTEPTSLLLMGLGLLGVAGLKRRK